MLAFNDAIVLLVAAIAVAIVANKLRFPYSIGLVLFGLILGVGSSLLPSLGHFSSQTGIFSPDVFFGILLPPLVYEAALHVDFALMRSRVWLILAFVFLGVIVSTVLTGFMVSTFTTIPFIFALLVGAMLSPTDPVAVVDLSKRIRLPPQLSTIIESESLLNDAVGIVVFSSVLQVVGQSNIAPLPIINSFLLLVLGGLATGLAVGALAYLLHRFVNDPRIEVTLSVVVAYGSFHIATALGASGIISTVVTGMVTGTWILPRAIQEPIKQTLFSFWSAVTYIVNSMIFLSMGLIVNIVDLLRNLPLILVIFGFVTLARASFIYLHLPLSKLARISRLPITWYNMLTLAGVRGAIPVVLVLTLSTDVAPIPQAIQSTVVSVVVGVAVLSVTFQSIAASRYATKHFGRTRDSDSNGTP